MMEEQEYRFFITRIRELEAENTSLREVLIRERASHDAYVVSVDRERAAWGELRAALMRKIARYENRVWIPGVILGGGATTRGELEGVVGLGWKIDLW